MSLFKDTGFLSQLRKAFRHPSSADAAEPAAKDAAASFAFEKVRLARERLAPLAAGEPAAALAAKSLAALEARLDRPPRIAVLGEFNTGKSSLAGLLLGTDPKLDAILRTIRQAIDAPILFRRGESPALFVMDAHGSRRELDLRSTNALSPNGVRLVEVRLPLEVLRRLEIVDVPGTGDPARDRTGAQLWAARSAHLALWCTLCTQAWKGSEQRAWLRMPNRLRAESLLIATHMDRLQGESDAAKVLARLRRETSGYFRDALLISTASPALWQASGGPFFASSLTPILAAIGARRNRQASRAASRIATAALGRLDMAGKADGAAKIAAAWQALASGLGCKIAEQPAAGEALLAEFVRDLRHFANATAAPWLRQNFGADTSEQILELFPSEPTALKEVIGELNGGAAAAMLRAVLSQLGEELAETLERVPASLPAPGRLPEERRLALETLFELSGAS